MNCSALVISAMLLASCSGSDEAGREPVDTSIPPDSVESPAVGGAGSMTSTTPPVKPPPTGAGVSILDSSACTDTNAIGPTPIRRISRKEYQNVVRDVFRSNINPGDLPSDEALNGFLSNVTTPLVKDHFDRYRGSARQISEEVLGDVRNRSGCSGAGDTACVERYLTTSARKAFHGTLEKNDEAKLLGLYRELASEDASIALSTALQFTLLSPRFLFLVEFGAEGANNNAVALTPSEVAGRLAAFLWQSAPDDALLQAADDGTLASADGVRQQAERLLSDDRAENMLRNFADQWLRIQSAAGDQSALAQESAAQPGNLMSRVSKDGALVYSDLIRGDSAPIGPALAANYGTTVDASGNAALPPERRGLLLSTAFLKSNSGTTRPSPVKRGYQIRNALLCDPIPPPPGPVNMMLPEPMAGVSEAEVFSQHSNEPECASCHKWMDPIGNSFAAYEADGTFNTTSTESVEGKLVPGPRTQSLPETTFSGPSELLDLLAEEPLAQQCFAVQMTRFALGRGEANADACGLAPVWKGFSESGLNVKELVLQVATSQLLTHRNPVKPGAICR